MNLDDLNTLDVSHMTYAELEELYNRLATALAHVAHQMHQLNVSSDYYPQDDTVFTAGVKFES